MQDERDELTGLLVRGGVVPEFAMQLARSIQDANYRKRAKHSQESRSGDSGIVIENGLFTVTGHASSLGDRIEALEKNLGAPEWGVRWGDEIRPVKDLARAKFIARQVGAEVFSRPPMGRWVQLKE